jgi:YggT family protein
MGLIAALLVYALYALIILVLIRAVFSWVSPYPTNPVSRFAYRWTEPLLEPIRRRIPPVSGIDLSATVVILVAFLLIGVLGNIR